MRLSGSTPTSEHEIERFERTHGIDLPSTYREFIRVQGGGSPEPNCFVDDSRKLRLFVATLFPLNDERMAEQRFPFPPPRGCGLLVIGTNGGGDYYLIALDKGTVFYWDHEKHDVTLGPGNVLYLARDVAALVNALVYEPGRETEEVDDIEELGRNGTPLDLEEFIKTRGLDAKSPIGRSVAEEAARYGNFPVLRRCLELGASTRNLLHFAAPGRSLGVIKHLVATGANVNELNEAGQSPLDRAIVRETYELLESLGARHAKRARPPHLR